MRHVLDLWRCSSLSMNRQEAKIFVGGLNWSTSEEKLRSYFENFGSVQEAFVSYDRHTGRPRGFGFVVFEDPLVADKVVSIQHTIDRREVEAKKAVPKDDQPTARYGGVQQLQRTRKIFVGGLAPSVDELAFRKYFEQFGAVEDAVVMYDHDNKRPRGFGFISFYSEEAVDLVLASGVWKTLHDKPIEIKRAVPRDQMPLGTPTPISSRGGRSWSESTRGLSARSMSFGMPPNQPLLGQQLYNSSRPPFDGFSSSQPGMSGYGDLSSSLGQSPLGISSLAGLLSQQQQAAGMPPQLPNSLPSNFQHMHSQHQHPMPSNSLPHQGLAESPQLPSHFGSLPYQLPSQQPPQYPNQHLSHLAAQQPSAPQLMPQSTAAALASLGLGGDFSSRRSTGDYSNRHSGLFNNLAAGENPTSSFHALDLERRMAATMGGMGSEGPFTHPFDGKSPHESPQSSSANSASQHDSASFGQSTNFRDMPFSVLGSTPQAHTSASYSSSPQIQSPHLQSPFAESAQSSSVSAASPKTPEANHHQQLNDQLDMLSLKNQVFATSFNKSHPETVES